MLSHDMLKTGVLTATVDIHVSLTTSSNLIFLYLFALLHDEWPFFTTDKSNEFNCELDAKSACLRGLSKTTDQVPIMIDLW